MNRKEFVQALDLATGEDSTKHFAAEVDLLTHDTEQRAEIERLTRINADHELNKPVLEQEIARLQAERDDFEIRLQNTLDERDTAESEAKRLQAQLATAKGEVWTKADFQEWLRRQQKEQP